MKAGRGRTAVADQCPGAEPFRRAHLGRFRTSNVAVTQHQGWTPLSLLDVQRCSQWFSGANARFPPKADIRLVSVFDPLRTLVHAAHAFPMSDIAIRFDGLLLAATLAIAASIYFALALAAAVVWLRTGRRRLRAWGIARKSGIFCLIYLTTLALVAEHLASSPPPVTGPDWLDWLSFPSLILFVIGCVVILRRVEAAPRA
jgi:hypothetical protein